VKRFAAVIVPRFSEQKILGSDLDYDLEVFVSPAATSVAKKAALIEAIEGHRAEPRNKPPFPGQIRLWQKPTVINNVETFIQRSADTRSRD